MKYKFILFIVNLVLFLSVYGYLDKDSTLLFILDRLEQEESYINITGSLRKLSYAPVNSKVFSIYLDGSKIGITKTKTLGDITFKVKKELINKDSIIELRFKRNHNFKAIIVLEKLIEKSNLMLSKEDLDYAKLSWLLTL